VSSLGKFVFIFGVLFNFGFLLLIGFLQTQNNVGIAMTKKEVIIKGVDL
jgi:hypothetical protein